MDTVYAVYSSIGTVRNENQDNFYLHGQTKPVSDSNMEAKGKSLDVVQLFVVCDGMGGEAAGEVAASLAVETFKSCNEDMKLGQCLDSMKEANRKICKFQRNHHVITGTTFAGIFINYEDAYAINVGDSRIYRIRDGVIAQLSRDHTEYQMMIDAGIPMNEKTKQSAKNRLTQFLGIPEEEMELEPCISRISPMRDGDRYLICSDGLYGVIADDMLLTLTTDRTCKLEAICKTLVDTAEKMGSRDNVTALLVEIVKGSEAVLEGERKAIQSLEQTQEIPKTNHLQGMSVDAISGYFDDPEKVLSENRTENTYMGEIQDPEVTVTKKKNRISSILKRIAAVAVVVIGCAYWFWSHPKVPDVVHKDIQSGQEILEKAGLKVTKIETFDPDIPEGDIIHQSKVKDIRVKRGDEIVVAVSKGIEPVEIPDVIKQSLRDGKELLEKQGFQVDIVWEYHKKRRAGVILEQIPSPGDRMIPGETVKITVSTKVKDKVKKGSD